MDYKTLPCSITQDTLLFHSSYEVHRDVVGYQHRDAGPEEG